MRQAADRPYPPLSSMAAGIVAQTPAGRPRKRSDPTCGLKLDPARGDTEFAVRVI